MDWIDGKPTQPGLYVIEWLNGGGLSVFLVKGDSTRGLYWENVEFNKPCEALIALDTWSVRRHLKIPFTPYSKDHPTHYEDLGDIKLDENCF